MFLFVQSHAVCHVNINSECTFGLLEPIYLPPHAVSIPRTEVPMEAIIGVQVRRKDTLSRKFYLSYDIEQEIHYEVLFTARSTSEEFSSGDAGRYRESEEYAQPHAQGRDVRQEKQNKNQEERDEGKLTIFVLKNRMLKQQ